MNSNYLQRITIDPEICHGKACIHCMRWPIKVIMVMLGSEMSIKDSCNRQPSMYHFRQLAMYKNRQQ
ncbi:MAG: DUF433 domain-containing protein [Bacteroidia bacterium]|nr:DUF433 domain-containing protein [Bacteroidia bacterium]